VVRRDGFRTVGRALFTLQDCCGDVFPFLPQGILGERSQDGTRCEWGVADERSVYLFFNWVARVVV
jgi:hypothetical protein